ncbi:HIT family protein [Dactylosporangium sp. AC04546]|uniref:HIT family protein n=1 Tax=Dactylosporangium sp. AC04546 TaxID=2862460 RepID=UPI001EDF3B49|nr:HIT family protein [Dactylosporangium sp. AC04546]WVK82539.1 HIT family protein [Dactylosporangium sp. AC04546]
MDCIFCAIVAGAAEASFVHQDDDVVAFMDLNPVTPGHLLVIPRRHAVGLADLEEAAGEAVWRIAHRLGRVVRHDGVNLFLADGVAAGQEVFHVHLHVVPRYEGDGFKLVVKPGRPTRAELDAMAASIREALP